jgi:hypothetical protein
VQKFVVGELLLILQLLLPLVRGELSMLADVTICDAICV